MKCFYELQMGLGFIGSPNSSLTSGQLCTAGLSGPSSMGVGGIEIQRLREELIASNLRLARWKEGITQARNVSRVSCFKSYCFLVCTWYWL